MLAGLEDAYERSTTSRDVGRQSPSMRFATTDKLLVPGSPGRTPIPSAPLDVSQPTRRKSKPVQMTSLQVSCESDDSSSEMDDENASNASADDSKRKRRRKQRDAQKRLVEQGTPSEKRMFFAITFIGIAVLLALTYMLSAMAVEMEITKHWFDNAFWTTACLFTAIGLVLWVPHDLLWLRDRPKKYQTVYCVLVAIFITLMVSSYHDFVDNRYVTEIMWRVIILLIIMAIYAIIPIGSFSHGWGGLFVVVLMTFTVGWLVIYPHRDYFRQYAHPADIPSHLSTLVPPDDLQKNGIVLLGTTAAMVYILYRMYHISRVVYVHDKMFLVTQLYMAVMVTLLICAMPRFNIPGVAWRNAMNQVPPASDPTKQQLPHIPPTFNRSIG